MGITISYRGSLKDLDRVEDFEDRALDLALEVGGHARIWRSGGGKDPCRMVRGIVLNLFPGQEPTSLLVAPEGWLVNLFEIDEAQDGRLSEPPWCFVKTQFGPIEGHVALVEMLASLKQEFLPDLEVQDEGGYWETRDLAALALKWRQIQAAIDGVAEGLGRFGLSGEAAEDQEILAARIERVARLVHRTLSRPAEHPPAVSQGDDSQFDDDESESLWDALYKENRRRQEHMNRAVEEHLARGKDVGEAVDAAMHEETALGLPDDSSENPLDDWLEEEPTEDDEPWRESLPPLPDDPSNDLAERRQHPLQQRAMELMLRLHELLTPQTGAACGHADALAHGAGEIVGGLAQALAGRSPFSSDEDGPPPFEPLDRGLSVVQLKRALRGAAFALGALPPLKAEGILDQPAVDELHAAIQALQADVFVELSRLRDQ